MEVYGGATSKAAIEKPSVKTFVISQSPLEKPLGGVFVVWSDLNGPKRALLLTRAREDPSRNCKWRTNERVLSRCTMALVRRPHAAHRHSGRCGTPELTHETHAISADVERREHVEHHGVVRAYNVGPLAFVKLVAPRQERCELAEVALPKAPVAVGIQRLHGVV